jgi:D-serine deaminase-like pyridoxal phosphate-dependent protein
VVRAGHDTFDLERRLEVRNSWDDQAAGRSVRADAAMRYYREKVAMDSLGTAAIAAAEEERERERLRVMNEAGNRSATTGDRTPPLTQRVGSQGQRPGSTGRPVSSKANKPASPIVSKPGSASAQKKAQQQKEQQQKEQQKEQQQQLLSPVVTEEVSPMKRLVELLANALEVESESLEDREKLLRQEHMVRACLLQRRRRHLIAKIS